MSTTTSVPRLPGLASPRDRRWATPGRPVRASLGAPFATSTVTAPFARLAPDGRRRPRGVVVTVLATLGWLPVLALTVVAFLVVGVVAGVAAASVWAWRSVSPGQARPAAPEGDAPRPASAPNGSQDRPRRRLVRDRTLGYDA
ncbi:hypothetical protein GJV82_09675 [Cellulosimicrobium sp. BIT-GX5]|uniref:Uncharacterized protein n=2 Tax=Cellulosimicrobium composti TaxID=2672572 RepID=A0A6N7ZIB8_9MICO|nr:hypothetical protein [Cellulosimicrobium composti]